MEGKILIVDDEEEICELLRFTFESEGYEVIASGDGKEALSLVQEERPDLIILDVMMPGLSGYEVCERLRSEGTTCLIPIVMLTSLGAVKDRITGIKLGADEYLPKPFEPYELLIRVEGLLRRSRESLSANPLTGLPGNISVEQEIKRCLDQGINFAVGYLDVDNFKPYNDKYGFDKGDHVIRLLAAVLRGVFKYQEITDYFLGHIGGEDFIFICEPDRVRELARQIIETFDSLVPHQYDEAVRKEGYIWAIDRQGKEVRFPLMTVSLGIIIVDPSKFRHYSQIVDSAKDLLREAKTQPGSSFCIS